MSSIPIGPYLQRLRIAQAPKANRAGLYALQRAHLLHIPFENLDIHYQRPIQLQLSDLYEKIVLRKRGGFCYELNGLFHVLLQALGFDSRMISARVYSEQQDAYSPEYDHLALLVQIAEQLFLVDVGFGAFTLEPLPLQLERTLHDPFGSFRFQQQDAKHYRVEQFQADTWLPQYIFQPRARALSEFQARCRFHEQDSSSHFQQKKLISLARPEGRITLTNKQLKIKQGATNHIQTFPAAEFEQQLSQHFHILI